MSRPLIALLINYRDERRTANCVRALLDNAIYHVLVWDNSEDGGSSSQALHQLFDDNLRVSIRTSSRNLGFASGVNRGIEVCRELHQEAWVLLINNDAVAPRDLAAVLSTRLEQSPSSLLAFPTLLHAGETIEEVYYHRWLGILSSKAYPGTFQVPRGCCLMLATDRWSGPLFDEDFFMYGEEIELGWKLRFAPTALTHAPDVVVVHEGSVSSGRNSLFYETRIAAAHLMLAHKMGTNTATRRSLYLLRILGLCARAGMRSLRHRSLNPWKGLWAGAIIASGVSQDE